MPRTAEANGVMTHVAINRIPVRPGNDELVRQSALAFFEQRRPLLGGDLRSMQLVRSTDGSEYALISVWASPEADAQHENDAAEEQVLQALRPIVAGAPSEFSGSLIAEL
jgi:heme-degrading monooxygenase HmoA